MVNDVATQPTTSLGAHNDELLRKRGNDLFTWKRKREMKRSLVTNVNKIGKQFKHTKAEKYIQCYNSLIRRYGYNKHPTWSNSAKENFRLKQIKIYDNPGGKDMELSTKRKTKCSFFNLYIFLHTYMLNQITDKLQESFCRFLSQFFRRIRKSECTLLSCHSVTSNDLISRSTNPSWIFSPCFYVV